MANEGVIDRAKVLESFQQSELCSKLQANLFCSKIEESGNGSTLLRYQPGPQSAEILEQVKNMTGTPARRLLLQDIFRALERIHECPPEAGVSIGDMDASA